MNSKSSRSNTLQLILGTGAFALCFAVFGSVSAMMPVLKKQFHLAPVQVSIAMAIPVLLGSLGRIPLGLLTDHLGGRKVFTWTMVASVVAALFMGKVESYSSVAGVRLIHGNCACKFFCGCCFRQWMVFGRETGIRIRRVWSRQRRAVTGRFRRPVVICPPRISQHVLELRGTACDLDRYLLYLRQGCATQRTAKIARPDGSPFKREDELGT